MSAELFFCPLGLLNSSDKLKRELFEPLEPLPRPLPSDVVLLLPELFY